MNTPLTPVSGCMVRLKSDPEGALYRVTNVDSSTGQEPLMILMDHLGNRLETRPSAVRSGILPEMTVQDVPLTRTRRSLGAGRVLKCRRIGGREQALVEFFDLQESRWIPYERLKSIQSANLRFLKGKTRPGQAERFRLKMLALALQRWNENTGALSDLDIDPLPHQIHLVHHILASGNLNWLIADDVGLGKTIEVGMLLAALSQRRHFQRVLIVCPAGLTRQWQEELADKFGMRKFEIFGRDFNIHDSERWRLKTHVIASIDRLKAAEHQRALENGGHWDLIVFDEAHRLSRRQYGLKFHTTERYKLATALRQYTDNMLLLTATPHQGKRDLFVALLELLRPESRSLINQFERYPGILREMVYRNRKADVTDTEGQFLFRGHVTRAIEVPVSDLQETFDTKLCQYVRKGYEAAKAMGQPGHAIGFVMTVFRKLAASSSAAIHRSLLRRRERLEEGFFEDALKPDLEDARFEGEHEENTTLKMQAGARFFEDEEELLDDLIELSARLVDGDLKLAALMDQLLPSVHAENPQEKVLLFTEYRGTQEHLQRALAQRFGPNSVALIHGGQSLEEKRASIKDFRGDALFLVSTEAGGEGLNLHHRCHVMVNYDLPWNPMRLVQRIGRLYRYGQEHKVVVFNLHAPQTLDARIVDIMYERIARVVSDLAKLSPEFHNGLREEIFGTLAGLTDLEDILQDAADLGEFRTRERIDEALEKAREAHKLHVEIFDEVQGFDPDELQGTLRLGPQHLEAFIQSMLERLGCTLLESSHKGRVHTFALSPEVAQWMGGRRQKLRLTVYRRLRHDARNIEVMDFSHPLLQRLLNLATSHDFGGLHASVVMGKRGMLNNTLLRWQDDQGRPMREELAIAMVDDNHQVAVNHPEVAQWLLQPADDGATMGTSEERKALLKTSLETFEERLAQISNLYLHPAQRHTVSTAWLTAAPEEEAEDEPL